jgi:hypothetical protein
MKDTTLETWTHEECRRNFETFQNGLGGDIVGLRVVTQHEDDVEVEVTRRVQERDLLTTFVEALGKKLVPLREKLASIDFNDDKYRVFLGNGDQQHFTPKYEAVVNLTEKNLIDDLTLSRVNPLVGKRLVEIEINASNEKHFLADRPIPSPDQGESWVKRPLELMQGHLHDVGNRTKMYIPTAQPNKPHYWLGDGSGHMSGDEARLLCHSLGLEPRDISVMCRAIGRDASPEVCKSWLRSSNGPPAEVCALLWEVEEAVEFVTRHATDAAKLHGHILNRNGDLAQIMFVSIKRLGLRREALQALQISAWVRCVERLRALDPSRVWRMQKKGDPHPSISPIVE